MRYVSRLIVLGLAAALSACSAASHEPAAAPPARAAAEIADPMASFARLVPGEWWLTLADGTSSYASWRWGPGHHSVHIAHIVDVYYWHPGRKQVCMLNMAPFARSVGEGTIRFDGETADAVFDLWQTSGLRKMGSRWVFDGPDKYRDTLLESTGPDGLQPSNAWEFVRKPTHTSPRATTTVERPKPPAHMHVLAPLLGRTWEAGGAWSSGEGFHVRTEFEWLADVDAIYARTLALEGGGEPVHVLDAYLFHHTGTETLRCLALAHDGGVYTGDWTVLEGGGIEGGALELDLQGYVGDRVVPRVVRFDFEEDGRLRQRIWSRAGAERTLLLDVHHVPGAPAHD